ncbi:hypothetical protein K490DRAFT_49442 [Saccharata proteae CBS 121410]|uniref:MFS general substrate transporter n=1 Tax=Saccharata proteae CBS 121410 TaxID=1314787 RepID=A0A9P4LTX6_9PEZI|nr:hypothetical protein K490DRAFT_49442 [Saccharata proteae CBS 121410]
MPFLAFTATRPQIATYLLGIALFSISFLVFLNSSLSFLITERIGQRHAVGDAVGTLGFADELVALVACPIWGILSDRVGVAKVAVAGYAIVGVSLFVFVAARNVYPQLLLARLFFSLGASATTTMVTAILPTMTHIPPPPLDDIRTPGRGVNGHGHTVSVSPSISSELTITPARYRSTSPPAQSRRRNSPAATTSRLAGLVGMFTGLGALLALGVFLPLPARFQKNGVIASEAVAYSFYIVGSVALAVAVACVFGLRDLPGEASKGWHNLCGPKKEKSNEGNGSPSETQTSLSYPRLFVNAMALAFSDVNVGLGYLGGFVARASSVAISLFIPLFTNAYYISSGLCEPGDSGSEDMKTACRRAYVLAAMLTGTSQLVALLCAPVFGYLSGKYRTYNQPLILSTVAGIAGYVAFGLLKSPDPRSKDGSAGVFFIAALLGISQIGAIVCSLGLLGRGINGEAADAIREDGDEDGDEEEAGDESNLHPHQRSTNVPRRPSRAHLKGSIAGVYSLAGGAGILLLTKVGGVMFDGLDYGAPFFLMAGFNALLLVAVGGVGFRTAVAGRRGRMVLP